MKNLIIGGLSLMLVSGVAAPAVLAESLQSSPDMRSNTSTSTYQIAPFDLVYMAYQGYFKNQGIPSAQALIYGYRTGDIDARDLVSSAVRANRLPSQMLADDDYLNAVDNQLNNLNENNGSLAR